MAALYLEKFVGSVAFEAKELCQLGGSVDEYSDGRREWK
jgi:hypothetical protein